MIKMTGCSAVDCGVGFVFGKGVNAELINSSAHSCRIGFLQRGSEQEWQLLLDKILTKPEELNQLAKDYSEAKPEQKKEAISKSGLFEYLSAFANASTVYQFLEDLVKSLLNNS
ncbi:MULTISPECIES: hypothetical protein [Citrobacter]|uniref:hypothetical protein n=1 Tax=Citrobacter TaxID=544 RepID=UPI000E3CDD34|nr:MULTISPECIES: hypothetical protein [Citrobacter]MBD0830029.1 hypothetical protein [Citrobacter sp. C1]RFU90238.1 hypothetical protein DZA29_18680 [Citrobacter gillenii]